MIKNVSNTFKSNCKKDSVKYREYIVIDNKEVDIKGDLSDTAYKDTTFFGKFNLKMLKFETENDIDYKKKEFTYYKEVDGEALKIGTFIVTDVSDSDTFESVNVTAYDYGLKFSNPYTTNLNYKNGNITMFQVVQEICNNCDIELENASLPNGSFIVDSNQFVNGEKYGDVICIVALENGMFATINSNNKLEFVFTNETDEIIEDYVELDDKRDTQPITSVLVAPSKDLETAGAVMKDQTLINQYGEHWLKIYDSYFANSTTKCQQLIGAIFNQVKGFGYSSFKSEYSFLPYLSLGDKIKFKNKEGKLVNSVILRYETNYDEMILEAPSIINASVEYELPETPEETSKKALAKVDQANGEIELIAKATEELETKTAQLRLDVDTIEGQISDIADITTTAEGVGTLVMNNINESEPIYIKIYPKLGDVTSLYPANDLYPADDLYPISKTLHFHCTSENYDAYYELPKDLLWLNNDVYDEFVLDYDNSACYIIRRVGVLENGTKYALANSIQENLEYPTIRLINGDYEVSLLGQPTAYLYIRLMVQNIYTTQFATKVEMNSKIKQTKDEIDLEVSKKVGNDEVISRINQTPETITIQANKVNIGGVINAINNNTSTTINGNKITTGSITADKVSSDVITTNNFNAQEINADKITAGTLSAANINLRGTYLSPNSSTIGGWDVENGQFSSSNSTGNSTINSNGEIYFYPTKGGILGLNDAFRCKGPAGIAIYNTHTKYGNSTYIDDGISLCADEGHLNLMNESSYYGVNIRSYCSPNTISNAGERSIRLAAGQNIAMYAVGGYCYAEGADVSSSKIKTANGSASSKNVKKNFKEFDNKKYERAINLLKDMKLYEYDYKYDLYKNRHQYGFIIDELQKLNGNEFFDFEEEEAIVKGEHLDFNLDNKSIDDEIIKVKSYNSDVLDKYLLTVVKGLLAKIEILEQKVFDLENKQKNVIIKESEGDK